MMDLNSIWFVLVAVLLIGYAALDGFDLGVGILHPLAKSEEEKRIQINAIGPVWDGNEVWLLTAGGALFAAFPPVYATVFSGFYLALMLLLVALIARAVSFEFRRQVDHPVWRAAWDWSLTLGSFVAALLIGVAFGNILHGIPLDGRMRFTGNFFTLLNPYSLLFGVMALILFTQHGALYLGFKGTDAMQARLAKLIPGLWIAMIILYLAILISTFFAARHLYAGLLGKPLFWITFIAAWAAMIVIPLAVKAGKSRQAWLASGAAIASLMGLAFTALYPRLAPSTLSPDFSLTIFNAASTPRTLTVMLVIALIGMPLVIGYTVFIYRMFKGRVVLHKDSY